MQEGLRKLANEQEGEAEIMQTMMWEKIEKGEIDMESYERMSNQIREHEFLAGRYTEQLYKLKGDKNNEL